jgi:hypothetical protein
VYFGPSKMVVLVSVAFAFGSALKPAFSSAAFASANPVFDVGMTVTLHPVSALRDEDLAVDDGDVALREARREGCCAGARAGARAGRTAGGGPGRTTGEPTSHCDRDCHDGRDEQFLA